MNGRKLEDFLGRGASGKTSGMGVDELQGLLLQVSFAIMMVFMMAYFLFRTDARKKQEEQVLELERQKLVIAAEAASSEMRAHYGLDVVEAADDFGDAPYFTEGGGLSENAEVRAAFVRAMKACASDLSSPLELRRRWMERVCELAHLEYDGLTKGGAEWLSREADAAVARCGDSANRARFRAASELQRHWLEHPGELDDPRVVQLLAELEKADETRRLLLVTELSAELKERALARLDRLMAEPVADPPVQSSGE